MEPSADSRYSRADDDEYRMETVVLESHEGLAMASFGEAVSAASAVLATRRLMIAAVRNIAVVITICDHIS